MLNVFRDSHEQCINQRTENYTVLAEHNSQDTASAWKLWNQCVLI